MIKIDLHTHSIISADGGITAKQYEVLLTTGVLDCIAVTDHNETRFARQLQKEFGKQIIVGEEITTIEGEMIGLFLEKTIPAGLSAKQTSTEIHKQGGLVYIPHPFETIRQGIQKPVLEGIVSEVDIIETCNGRGRWRGKAEEATLFATKHHIVQAASSDAHGAAGAGKTYSILAELPTRTSLKQLLQKGSLQRTYAPLWTFLYPTINRIKHSV